jgi:regulator of ribonuclease activity A
VEFTTADLFDANSDSVAVCDIQFRNFGGRQKFFGPCQTLKVLEDHSPLREGLDTGGAGRVLIVDAGGATRVGVLGDRLAALGAGNGWSGIVVFGAVRDSTVLSDLDIGVKALGTTARRAVKPTTGEIGVRVEFGAAVFEPGDWVYADADAVLVSRTELQIALIGDAQ